jgi:hypothetical protein
VTREHARASRARVSKRLCRWAGAALVASAVAAYGARSAAPSFPAPQQRLIYLAESDDGTSVYVADTRSGSKHALVLPNPGLNGGVASNAQGTRIAYTDTSLALLLDQLPPRLRRRLPHLPASLLGFGTYTPAPPGGFSLILVRASTAIAAYGRPAWSPDGRQLAFAGGERGQLDIYLLTLGRRSKPVDLTPNSPGNDQDPSWSPDGHTIAFASNRDGNSDIYLMNPDGSDTHNITNSPARERYPDWSPTSDALVFTSNHGGSDQLYTSRTDGTDLQRLTNSQGDDRHPAWSPDGNWIAFSRNQDGQNDIYLIDPRDRTEHQLTSTVTEEIVQDWQPLHDTINPRIRALPSHGLRDRPIYLRYRVRENSSRVQLIATITGPHYELSLGLGSFLRRNPGHTYALRLDPDALYDTHVPRTSTFCITASDPSGNTSSSSCSTLRLFRP